MRVTYKRHWGTDLDVVNNARVSFGKESEWVTEKTGGVVEGDSWTPSARSLYNHKALSKKDIKLISYLAKHNHWVPFANGIGVTLHLKVPIFIATQLKKHQVGFDVSEISRRYVSDTPEFYVPGVWRKAPEVSVKQGSSDETINLVPFGMEQLDISAEYEQHRCDSLDMYDFMIKVGVCPEQARMVLPQSMYTEMVMSGSLVGWARMYNQRSDSQAQKEVQEVAAQVQEIIKPLYPNSWSALTSVGRSKATGRALTQ